MEISQYEEVLNDDPDDGQYPCSCGHCPECGLNFTFNPGEEEQWANEDAEYYDNDRLGY